MTSPIESIQGIFLLFLVAALATFCSLWETNWWYVKNEPKFKFSNFEVSIMECD